MASQMRKDRSLAANRRLAGFKTLGKGVEITHQPSPENGFLAPMWLVNIPLSKLPFTIGNLRCHCLELRRIAY